MFLIDQNAPFYSHKVLRTLPEQASLTLHLLMCPALYASHCGYIKRVSCPRAGEECLKDADESLSVGKGQNGCHIRRPWSDREMFSSLQPLLMLGSKAIVVCTCMVPMLIPRDGHKAACVRLLWKTAPQHGHVHGGLTTSPM